MSNATYKNPSLGCYCDGANGQDYNDRKVIRLALGYGWQDESAKAYLEAFQEASEDKGADVDLPDADDLADMVNDAENWLNEQETRPFTYWGWNDGNFGLWANVDGAREDCGFVSRKHVDETTDSEDASYPAADYRGEWLHVSDHGNATLYVRGEDGKDAEIWGVV